MSIIGFIATYSKYAAITGRQRINMREKVVCVSLPTEVISNSYPQLTIQNATNEIK